MKFKAAQFLTLSILLLLACKEEESSVTDSINYVKESYQIGVSETFTYSFGSFDTEGTMAIQKQAKNFEISEVFVGSNGMKYQYKPEFGFTGVDYVEIRNSVSAGDLKPNQIFVYQIEFNVVSD